MIDGARVAHPECGRTGDSSHLLKIKGTRSIVISVPA